MNSLEEETQEYVFLDKLITVYEKGELDYWEDRNNSPNLSRDEFILVLYRIDDLINLKWPKRISKKGIHGKAGEEYCFKFNCEIKFGGIFDIEIKYYFIKGYFFDDGKLKGFSIQSFRED